MLLYVILYNIYMLYICYNIFIIILTIVNCTGIIHKGHLKLTIGKRHLKLFKIII